MTLRLEDTTAGAISSHVRAERHRLGATATGMVMTLVIVTDEENQSDATRAAAYSAREHPCRILTVIPRPGREEARLDADIAVGDTEGPGETIRLRLRGELAKHCASVTLPLLLPDTPVVVWWPTECPDVPSQDPMGRLAQRRITDAAASRRSLQALKMRQVSYAPGDTDLSWTRTTVWRSMLAAALDQPFEPIKRVDVSCERSNPSGPLLQAWLKNRLKVAVDLHRSQGPGITGVTLHTAAGPIELSRPDGRTGRLVRPNVVPHEVPLARRELRDLMGEEMRRLDPDDTYAEALRSLNLATPKPVRRRAKAAATKKAAAAKTTKPPAKASVSEVAERAPNVSES